MNPSNFPFSPRRVVRNQATALRKRFPTKQALTAASLLALLPMAGGAFAQTFLPGNLVVSRVEYNGDPNNFNNPNFSGIQGNVFFDQYTTVAQSARVSTLALPQSSSGGNSVITSSFSSKSEGAVMLSTNGQYLTYIGYAATAGTQSVSNSFSTAPGVQPPGTNPASEYNRVIASVSLNGAVNSSTLLNNAYSGDNPRAVISTDGTHFYSAGNASNNNGGGNPLSTIGARYSTEGSSTSTLVGTVTGSASKSDNIRAINIYNGNLYVAKGSGGNGTNGIFQVSGGLPTTGGHTVTALPGLSFNTAGPYFPFGFFFASPTVLYIADEGPGSLTPDSVAGLEKWTFNSGLNKWVLDYTLQNGLNLDVAETVAGYTETNGNLVNTYTTGLRNLAGVVNGDSVSLYGITAQFSDISNGEPDPTNLVSITDSLSATSLPLGESFTILQNSGAHEVFRGVAFVPEPGSIALLASLGLTGAAFLHRRKTARKTA